MQRKGNGGERRLMGGKTERRETERSSDVADNRQNGCETEQIRDGSDEKQSGGAKRRHRATFENTERRNTEQRSKDWLLLVDGAELNRAGLDTERRREAPARSSD